ncbi:hypothetical protein GCM10022207_32840 [Streptomyces lannensis]|uniref:Uncharacterized protein n=1 Tax=Streptomyces lannensis TaxID=766498 RepID=A0ABP7K5L3_9ACTN
MGRPAAAGAVRGVVSERAAETRKGELAAEGRANVTAVKVPIFGGKS